jgi:8-oxo-dGTP pyrophosphatase MutT (NUDIX family)
MHWKTLQSEYLFKDNWLTLRVDECEKPDGTIIKPYYVYEFTDWVTAVPFTKDGKIIMIEQYRHALGEVSIEIPGGCVDKTDPHLEEACKRELLEETGYVFDEYTYLCKTSANPSTNNNLMHIFLATGGVWEQPQHLDQGEDIKILLLSVEEVKQLISANKIIQSMHVTALWYAFQKMGFIEW